VALSMVDISIGAGAVPSPGSTAAEPRAWARERRRRARSACYGKGGDQATVTDANLFLGYLGNGWAMGLSVALRAEEAWRIW
jgi:N-methylhydantoinase A